MEHKGKRFNPLYIFFPIIILLIVMFVYREDLVGLFNQPNKVIVSEPIPEYAPAKNKKFVYTIFETEVPKLKVTRLMEGYRDINGIYNKPLITYDVEWTKYNYTSEILEFDDYTDDDKYRMLDGTEKNLKMDLSSKSMSFYVSVQNECKDEKTRERFENIEAKIKTRDILAFDSYMDASISKRSKIDD